jgi:hypothetical protein
LRDGDATSDFDDIVVECLAYIVEVGEDEGFGHVESYCDDIFSILASVFLDILDCQVWSEEEFLVVGELNYKGDIKDVL